MKALRPRTGELTSVQSSVQLRGAIVTVLGSSVAANTARNTAHDDRAADADAGAGDDADAGAGAADAGAGDDRDAGAGVDDDADAGTSGYDFASRYFAPWVGINEDPVTGR